MIKEIKKITLKFYSSKGNNYNEIKITQPLLVDEIVETTTFVNFLKYIENIFRSCGVALEFEFLPSEPFYANKIGVDNSLIEKIFLLTKDLTEEQIIELSKYLLGIRTNNLIEIKCKSISKRKDLYKIRGTIFLTFISQNKSVYTIKSNDINITKRKDGSQLIKIVGFIKDDGGPKVVLTIELVNPKKGG